MYTEPEQDQRTVKSKEEPEMASQPPPPQKQKKGTCYQSKFSCFLLLKFKNFFSKKEFPVNSWINNFVKSVLFTKNNLHIVRKSR